MFSFKTMGIRQVEKLYKKIIDYDESERECGSVNAGVRTQIFQRIMEDVERLMKKKKRCEPGSEDYDEIDSEIRQLLLKEIQVIVDDYTLALKNGTLERWKKMYGDIDHYIGNFYLYRSPGSGKKLHNYGFYDHERIL